MKHNTDIRGIAPGLFISLRWVWLCGTISASWTKLPETSRRIKNLSSCRWITIGIVNSDIGNGHDRRRDRIRRDSVPRRPQCEKCKLPSEIGELNQLSWCALQTTIIDTQGVSEHFDTSVLCILGPKFSSRMAHNLNVFLNI